MKRLHRAIFLLSTLGISSRPALTNSVFLISGSVHDSAGARIGNAQVTARGSTAGATRETDTDGQGEFRLEVPRAGSYQVSVRANGFNPASTEAVVSEASPEVHLDLTLTVAGGAANSLTLQLR